MDRITEIEGDLFDAPDGAVLIHACNCQGSWGKGIAEVFRARYPAAYRIFRSHCQSHLKHSKSTPEAAGDGNRSRYPEGTALIIPPQLQDYQPSDASSTHGNSRGRGQGRGRGRGRGGGITLTASTSHSPKRHWIVCLFTSWHYGPKNRSPPDVILANTESALADLKSQLDGSDQDTLKTATTGNDERKEGGEESKGPGELFACRLNAGLFGVPWEQTRSVLEKSGLRVTVVSPPGEHASGRPT